MIESGFYNRDCMDAMKEFPDKFFDLAIVDPPYGDGSHIDGGGYWNRFGQRFDRYKQSEPGGGWHGKHPYHTGSLPVKELSEARRDLGLCELAAHGQRSTQKNY